MTEFIGRRKELAALASFYEAGGGALVPVYGRRRVGKSELILRFIEQKPALYMVGKKAPAGLQMREFLEVAARALDEPLFRNHPATGWREILLLILERWRKPEKLILVFDEFQWMVEASPELPSVLQEVWDRRARKSQAMIILCGSYVGFMEREVLAKKSPLFGRRTGHMFVRPFSFREAAEFHPRASLQQKALTYFLLGGIPLYLKSFSRDLSVPQNIVQTFLNEYSPLSREPEFLLHEELREVENYYALLMALSQGSLTLGDIARRTGLPERGLGYYLHTLLELGYIAKKYPLSEMKPAALHVRYVLTDPLLRFWFRFIYPHQSLITQLGPQDAYRELMAPNLDTYWGACFENLCREALPSLYEQEKVMAPYSVGEYWNKEVQIDLVGLREDHRVDLGECKWGTIPSLKAVAEDLRRKSGLFPNREGRSVHLRLFSQGKVSPVEGLSCFSLGDLYGVKSQ